MRGQPFVLSDNEGGARTLPALTSCAAQLRHQPHAGKRGDMAQGDSKAYLAKAKLPEAHLRVRQGGWTAGEGRRHDWKQQRVHFRRRQAWAAAAATNSTAAERTLRIKKQRMLIC